MLLLNIWDDRPQDIIVLALVGLLLFGAFKRGVARRTRRLLFVANLSVAVALLLALPVFYDRLDPLLGGVNLLNYLSRLLVLMACWAVTYSLTLTVQSALFERTKQWYAHPVWVGITAVALFAVYAPIGFSYPSHVGLGAAALENSPVLVAAYQPLTIAPLLLGSGYLVPRLYKLIKMANRKAYKIQLCLYLSAYILSWLILIFSAGEVINPVVQHLRVYAFYFACLTLTVALIMSVKASNSARRITSSAYKR